MSALIAGLIITQTSVAQSPAASPSPAAASPSTAAESARWMRVDAPLLETVDTIEHATTIGTEVVAIGTRCDAEGVCGRVALATPDGLVWEERGLLPTDVELVGELIADEGALIAVGRAADGVGAIWRSEDAGATWEQVGGRAAFRPGAGGRPRRSPTSGNPYEVTVISVARGPSGLVAGGWLNSEDDDRSAIWRETERGTWQRVRLRPAMERAGGVFDVTGGVAAYVAVTADEVWRSRDARSWVRTSVDEAGPPSIRDVEATEAGFIGVVGGPGAMSTWVSAPDGRRWQKELDDPAFGGLVTSSAIHVFDGRDVVVGGRVDLAEEIRDDRSLSIVWSREHGAAWTAETVSDDFFVELADVVSIGGRLLVVGSDERANGTSTGAAWLREDWESSRA